MSTKDKAKQNIRIFLSYAAEDSNRATELMNELAKQPNVHVFTSDKMSAGENWRAKIKKALSESDFFLVLLSPTSVSSRWIQFELGVAWGLNKLIIPIVTSRDVVDRIPLNLAELPFLEMKQLKRPQAISEIMERYEKSAA
jgi:hypothetical protein